HSRSMFFFSNSRLHTRFSRDWSSDVCSSDLREGGLAHERAAAGPALEVAVEHEVAERLAHGHAAHAVRLHELLLGGDALPGRPPAGEDLLAQQRLELAVEGLRPRPVDTPAHGRYTSSPSLA